jgi:RNA polymerase sigma-70 factor (ECF subfamily)
MLRDQPPTAAVRAEELAGLFRDHVDFVWRVLRRLGVPQADVEDVAQEVFLVVARKLDAYQEQGAMRAWLFSVARQLARNTRRAEARRRRRDQLSDAPVAYGDPHELTERQEGAALVELFMSRLEATEALVFFLSEVEGISAAEVAQAIQLDVSAVYVRQRVVRKRFQVFVKRLPARRGVGP